MSHPHVFTPLRKQSTPPADFNQQLRSTGCREAKLLEYTTSLSQARARLLEKLQVAESLECVMSSRGLQHWSSEAVQYSLSQAVDTAADADVTRLLSEYLALLLNLLTSGLDSGRVGERL